MLGKCSVFKEPMLIVGIPAEVNNKMSEESVVASLTRYNHFHNILRLSDVLPNFPFTASETMCNYYL